MRIRRGPRLKVGQNGAAVIESTFALPIFFFIVMLTMELLRICYQQLTIQYVLTSVMRVNSTRPVAARTSSDVQSQITKQLAGFGVVFDAAQGDSIDMCPVSQFDKREEHPCGGVIIPGLPQNLVALQVSKRVRSILLPTYTLSSMVIGKNEPV